MEAQQAQLAEAHQQWRLQAELNGRAERRYNEGLEDFARLSEVTASAAAAWSPHLQSGAPQQPPAVPQHAQLLQQQQQQMQQLQQLHQQSQQQQPQQQPLHHQQPQQQPQQPPPPPQQQPPPPQPQQHDGGAVSIHGVADRTADAAVGASGPASGGTSSPPGPQPGQGAQQPQHAGAVLLEMLKGQSGGPCDGKPLQGAPGDGEELDEIDQMLRSCAVAHLDGDPGGDPWRHLGPQRAGPQAHPRAQAQPPPSQPQQGFQPPPPSAPAPPAPGRPRAPPSHQAGRQATGPGVAPLQPAAAPSPPLGGPQHAPPPPSAAAPPRGAPSAQPLSQQAQAPPLQQPAAAHAPQRTGGDATRSFEQDPRWTQQRHYAEDPRQQKPPQQPQPPPQRPVHAAADGRRPEEAGRGQRPAAGERQDHHREGSPEQPLALDGGPELWRGAGRAQSSQLAQEVLEKFFKPWCMQRATQLFRFAHRHFTEGKERGGVVFRFQHTGEVAGGRWMPDEHSWSYQSQRSIGGLGIKTNHVLSAVQRYSPQQQCVVVVLVTEPRFDRFYILNAPKPQPGGGRAGADARSRAEWYGGNH